MGLTNAERQKRWRERHRNHIRVPLKVQEAYAKTHHELLLVRREVSALRHRVAELTGGELRHLRLPAEIPDGEEPDAVEARLHNLFRWGKGALEVLTFLFDYAGPEATVQAIRRQLAAIEAKEKARWDAEVARAERRKAREARKAAVTT